METSGGREEAAGTRGRRTFRRRTLQVIVGLAFLILLLAILAVGFLHTPPGSTAARALLEGWGSRATGGRLRLGSLELRLWRGQASVTAPSLALEGVSLDARRIELDWSAKTGPHVRVIRPSVVVRKTGAPRKAPAGGLAAQPWRALERLAKAEVTEGRLEVRDPKGEPWLVLGRFDLEMAEAGGRRRVFARIADAAVGWRAGDLRLRPASAEASLALADGRLLVEQARVTAAGASLELHGILDRIAPITASASARAALDGGFVGALAPGADVAGRIEAEATLEVRDDNVGGTLAATSPALTVKRTGPWAANGHGRLEGLRLVLEALEARAYGGRLMAQGPLALLPSARTDLRLHAQGIDVAALVASLAGSGVKVAGRADATLRWTTTGWDVAAASGSGEFTLRPPPPAAARGLPLSGSGRVRIAGQRVALEGVNVAAHGARVTGEAEISGDGTTRGRWTAEMPLGSLPVILADLGHPTRMPEVEGALLAEGDLAGPLGGPVLSARLRGDSLSVRGDPLSLEAETRLAKGRLSLAPLVLRSGSGRATLTGGLPVSAEAGEWDVAGEIESFDLEPALGLAGLDGHGPLTGTLRVSGPRDEPVAAASLNATVALRRPRAGSATGADGAAVAPQEDSIAVALAATGRRGWLAVERLEAELAGGRVEGSGEYDARSGRIRANATAAGLAWARLPLAPAAARALGGTLDGEVAVSGTTSAPSGELRARLTKPTLNDAALPPVSVEARAGGRELRVTASSAEAVFLRGRAPLAGAWPLRLEIDAAALPLQAILQAFPAARDREATITAAGGLTLDLPLRAPGGLRYSAEALRASGKVRQREWATEPFRLEGDRDALTLAGLRLTSAGATLGVDGRVPLSPSASYDLAVAGTADLELLDVVLPPGDRATGTSALRLRVAGSAAEPEVTGEATIDGARGRFEGARWRELRVRARFLGREAEVEELSARVLGGSLTAHGRLPLRALGKGEPAKLSFEAKDVDLARLLDADLRLEGGASFLVSIDGELEASAPTIARTRVRGRVVRFESKSPEGTIGLDAPAAFRLENGRFEQDPIRLTGPLGTLEARVEARLAGGPAAGSATIAGPFDLRFLSPFVPETTLSGPATVDLRASWGGDRPRLDGALKIEKARVVLEELAFAVTQLSGELRFEGDRVALEAAGASGDGKLRARGGMTLGPAFFGPAEVTLEAERVPIAYPEGFRGRASGRVLLSGDPENAYIVSGDVALRQGYYTAEFDAGTQSIGRLDWQLAALRGGTIGEMLALDIDVRLEGPLRIRNRRASLDVLGSMTASGTLAQPTATGQVSLREGGTLTLSRASVRVVRGAVELNGYPGGTPELDLQGSTRVGGVGINVQARGRVDDLQLTFDSPDRPDLSQTDLVTLLLTGRTASAVASQGGVIVAEELASALGGVLQKGVGESVLIDVSPDRSLLADDTDPTQRFNIGHRLTENLVVMYSTALDGTEQRWILDFNPGGGRFRYRLIDEEDESISVEVTDRFSFDLWNRGRRPGGRREREVRRLSALRFEGELPLPEEELRKAADIKVGRRQSGLRREEAADRVRALLAKKGWAGAAVDADAVPSGDRTLELVMRVTPGPRVSFQWRGDPLGGKERKAAEAAWPAYASPDVAAAAVARAALVGLQTRGHHAAKVTPEASAGEREVEVRLLVEAGPRGGALSVEFEGNEALDDRALAAALPEPGSRAFFEALAGRSSGLTNPLRLAYARAGYVDARVRPPQTEVDAATGALTVTFTVRERGVSPVAGIVLPEEVVAAGAEGPAIATKVGAPFDVAAYVADRDAVGAWYRREGWPDARVIGFLDPGPDGVSVRFAARSGPRPRVGEVRVAQEGRAQERVVRRAVTLEPGDLVRPRELAESRERLAELGIFRSVEVRAEARPGQPELRDIVVNVATRPDVTVEYGLRYSTEGSGGAGSAVSTPAGGRLQVAGGVDLANPLGWGWRVRGYTLLTTDRQTWGVNLDAASLFGLRLRSQLLVYDDTDEDIQIAGLASRVKGVTFQQTRTLLRDLAERRWHDRLRLQWGYTFKDVTYVDDARTGLALTGNRAFLSLALIGDERDSLTDPRRGLFWTATTELARGFLGSDADYQRFYGQAFVYLPLLGRLVWAQGYRAGVVPGEDPSLLIENRFRAGGPTTVRGFEQNGLGPMTPEGDSLGGQAVAVVNQELRFPIWKRVHGGVFWDAGNVWLTSSGFSFTDLRQSIGAGLRIMFPFGPIRLEYAWVLKPQTGEAKGRIVFGLGHAF